MENFDLTKYLKVEVAEQFTSEMFAAGIKCYKFPGEEIYIAEWDFRYNRPLKKSDDLVCVFYKRKDGLQLQNFVSKEFIRQKKQQAYEQIKMQIEKAIKNAPPKPKEIICPKCGEKENFHFNDDYSKKERPLINILCNECGSTFKNL